MAKWPKEVSLLTAKDIHRGRFHGPNGTHCLLGWVYTEFPPVVQEQVKAAIRREAGTYNMVRFNDDLGNSKTKLARVWNRAMARFGYVVGNPAGHSAGADRDGR